MKERFLLIAWPEDHDEDIPSHAWDIADLLIDMGCPQVIRPLPEEVVEVLETELWRVLP